jgi:hypothetical protein
MSVNPGYFRWIVLMSLLAMARPAVAETPPPQVGNAQSSANAGTSSGSARVVAGLLWGAAAVAVGTGTYLAISKGRAVGGCVEGGGCTSESNLVTLGLGLDVAGGALAMIGTFLWFDVPQTGTRVAVGPSALFLSGTF